MKMKTEPAWVKLNTSRAVQNFAQDRDGISRPTTIISQAVGDVVSMPADEAQRYIERGMASAAQDPTQTLNTQKRN